MSFGPIPKKLCDFTKCINTCFTNCKYLSFHRSWNSFLQSVPRASRCSDSTLSFSFMLSTRRQQASRCPRSKSRARAKYESKNRLNRVYGNIKSDMRFTLTHCQSQCVPTTYHPTILTVSRASSTSPHRALDKSRGSPTTLVSSSRWDPAKPWSLFPKKRTKKKKKSQSLAPTMICIGPFRTLRK